MIGERRRTLADSRTLIRLESDIRFILIRSFRALIAAASAAPHIRSISFGPVQVQFIVPFPPALAYASSATRIHHVPLSSLSPFDTVAPLHILPRSYCTCASRPHLHSSVTVLFPSSPQLFCRSAFASPCAAPLVLVVIRCTQDGCSRLSSPHRILYVLDDVTP